MPNKCCDNPSCSRSQSIRIIHGPLSGRFFAVTKWKARNGQPNEALEKHEIAEEDLLSSLREAGYSIIAPERADV